MKIINQERPIKQTRRIPYINLSSCNPKTEEGEFPNKGLKYTFDKDISLKEEIPKIEREDSKEETVMLRNITQNEISKQEKLGKRSNIEKKNTKGFKE